MFKEYIGVIILGLMIVAVSAIGFSTTGSPLSQKDIQLDTTRLNEFSQITRSIESYFMKNGKLPPDLKTVSDDKTYSYETLQLTDLESNKPYQYDVLTPTSYKLCTTFSVGSSELRKKSSASYSLSVYEGGKSRTLEFSKGYDCITYNVTPRKVYNPSPTPKLKVLNLDPYSKESDCNRVQAIWENNSCKFKFCKDSDNSYGNIGLGRDESIYTKGIVDHGNGKTSRGNVEDYCYNSTVVEHSCVDDSTNPTPGYYISAARMPCPNGCVDGACVK